MFDGEQFGCKMEGSDSDKPQQQEETVEATADVKREKLLFPMRH